MTLTKLDFKEIHDNYHIFEIFHSFSKNTLERTERGREYV